MAGLSIPDLADSRGELAKCDHDYHPPMLPSVVRPSDLTITFMSLSRPEELDRTLQGIGQGPDHRSVILNGADLDAYRSVIQTHQSRVDFMVNPSNLGFAAACNQAIATSSTRYTVISGDDLEYSEDWMERLLERLNQPSPPGQLSLSYPLAFSSFCVDKSFVAGHGWFDQNFTRVYYEDDDWCLRVAERNGQPNRPGSAQDVMPRLDVVKRSPHERAPWNSVPNRVYFYRKWKRLSEPSERSLYLRPHVSVERRLPDPVWPHLEPLRRRYEEGDYAAQPYVYDPPELRQRLLTRATSNRLVISARIAFQRRFNPDQELR
jgi:glycosyltransferase involved in cell wall biosynthesis